MTGAPARASGSTGSSGGSSGSTSAGIRVRERGQFDLMLLAVVGRRVGDGFAVAAALSQRTGGRVVVPARVVFTSLHRLARNRLVRREAGGYVLTASGERSLAAKRREWRTLQTAMTALLDSDD